MKLRLLVAVMAVGLMASTAQAVDICVSATAAEAQLVTDAKALLEVRLGRTLTAQQFVKIAARELTLQLLAAENAKQEQNAAITNTGTYTDSIKTEFPEVP